MSSWGLKLSSCGQRRLWADRAYAQADLSLRRAHNRIVGFVTRWLILWNFNTYLRQKWPLFALWQWGAYLKPLCYLLYDIDPQLQIQNIFIHRHLSGRVSCLSEPFERLSIRPPVSASFPISYLSIFDRFSSNFAQALLSGTSLVWCFNSVYFVD